VVEPVHPVVEPVHPVVEPAEERGRVETKIATLVE